MSPFTLSPPERVIHCSCCPASHDRARPKTSLASQFAHSLSSFEVAAELSTYREFNGGAPYNTEIADLPLFQVSHPCTRSP
jgi:hypothetical protein